MTLPALGNNADTRSITERSNRLIREFNRVDRKAPIVGTDTGTATAYAIAPAPGIALYEVGQVFAFQAANANSGTAPTFNANGKGAGTITYPDGSALGIGDIGAGATVMLMTASAAPTFHLLTGPVAAFIRSSLLTTRGDLLTRGASANQRLALGASGLVLTSDGTDALWQIPTLTKISASLGADVALNNTTSWFDGASIAQGTSGIWFVVGHATFTNGSTNINPNARIYDGTNVHASGRTSSWTASALICISLSAIVTNPAGNLRIQGQDPQFTTSTMKYNASGQSADTMISAVRIG